MFAIRDPHSAGRIMMWVKHRPTWLPAERYLELPDTLYERIKHGTFWIDGQGFFTFEKPYTFKYHYWDGSRWRLDHDKVSAHIIETKQVFMSNVQTYVELGLEEEQADYLRRQIEQIQTLDDVEEFSLVQLGGEYAAIYQHRYNIAI